MTFLEQVKVEYKLGLHAMLRIIERASSGNCSYEDTDETLYFMRMVFKWE